MPRSTKETALELQGFLSNEGAYLLHEWMEGMRADLLAVATAAEAGTAETLNTVAAITNIEE